MPEFKNFSYLPPELRQSIWDVTLCEESTTRLILMWPDTRSVMPTRFLYSPLFVTNRESRSRAIAFYNVKLPVWRRRVRVTEERPDEHDAYYEFRPTADDGSTEGIDKQHFISCGAVRINLATDLFVTGFEDVPLGAYLFWKKLLKRQDAERPGPWNIPLNHKTAPLTVDQCQLVNRALRIIAWTRGEDRNFEVAMPAPHYRQLKSRPTFGGFKPSYGDLKTESVFGDLKMSLHILLYNNIEGTLFDLSRLDGDTFLSLQDGFVDEEIPRPA